MYRLPINSQLQKYLASWQVMKISCLKHHYEIINTYNINED